AVHPARAVEDRVARVGPRGGRDRVDAAEARVDEVGVLEDLAGRVERLDDLRVVERDLVRVPLVVNLGTRGAQDDVLDPVGRGPAGRVTGLDAGAPRHAAVLDDLRGEVHHLGPRRRDLVAGVLEHRRRVPDVRLDVRPERRGVERAVDGAVLLPRLAEELVDVRDGLLRCGDDLVREVVDDRVEQAGLRQVRDVGGVARLDADEQLRLELARALVVDRDARALLERVVRRLLRRLLGLDDRRVDGDLRALEVTELLVGGAVDLRGRGVPAAVTAVAVPAAATAARREHEREARPAGGDRQRAATCRAGPRGPGHLSLHLVVGPDVGRPGQVRTGRIATSRARVRSRPTPHASDCIALPQAQQGAF